MTQTIIGSLLALAMLGGGVYGLATLPAAFAEAERFATEAKAIRAVVLANEQRTRTSGKTGGATWWEVTLRLDEDDGSSREVSLPGTSEYRTGDEVYVYVSGDAVHWDRDVDPLWSGPYQQLGMSLGVLFFGSVIAITMVRLQLKARYARGHSITLRVYGDSKDALLDTVRTTAHWGEDGRLFAYHRNERYAVRCERCEGDPDGRPEAWILKRDRIRPDDVFYVFYDD